MNKKKHAPEYKGYTKRMCTVILQTKAYNTKKTRQKEKQDILPYAEKEIKRRLKW